MMIAQNFVSSQAKCNVLNDRSYDVVIIGTGIAGMTVALSLDPKLKVGLVSKESIAESSTYKAQGGMAISLGVDDSPEEHIADTLHVGRGLCHHSAVEAMVREGPLALEFLESLGTDFNYGEDGLYLTREAGHSRNRIVHYYDYTGREIAETMAKRTSIQENVECLEHCFFIELLTRNGQCCGCIVMYNGRLLILHSRVVVIATGGYSGLFARSTNAISSNGDGIAAAYRAGAVITDMEFVQFHPTAFTTLSGKVFLLTEALRGEGAVLRNRMGERFMLSYHSDGELAPRDEVSRGIASELASNHVEVVYLDARHLKKEYLKDRFRQVYSQLADNGYFMERDLIPIAPAAHYTIGGISTDLQGKTTVPGLYACGEAAATGVHGANRLASNSLLEGVVFGRRVAQDIDGNFSGIGSFKQAADMQGQVRSYGQDTKKLGVILDRVAGVVRRGKDMKQALSSLQQKNDSRKSTLTSIQEYQTSNAFQLAELLLEAALLRCESRGAHFREDYSEINDVDFNKHVVQQWGKKAVLG
jgi:L-aspartate oxidase